MANIIGECIQDLQTFEKTYMAHEYCESSIVVNRLENWVVKHNEVAKWMDRNEILSKVNKVIERDCILGRLGIIKYHNES